MKYPHTTLKVGEPTSCEVTLKNNTNEIPRMLIADIAVPPGAKVDPGEFEKLIDEGKIDQFSISPRAVTLYLDKLGKSP